MGVPKRSLMESVSDSDGKRGPFRLIKRLDSSGRAYLFEDTVEITPVFLPFSFHCFNFIKRIKNIQWSPFYKFTERSKKGGSINFFLIVDESERLLVKIRRFP